MAGSNCVLLHYTGKVCDVAPYRDDYDSVNNVPIVTAATAWQSPTFGQEYILVFNEALWMGDTMTTSLINPNQLRHFGTHVQDNPMSQQPLSIVTEDCEFSMNLSMAGTIVYVDTFTPSSFELDTCPHIQLTSHTPWDPYNVKFPQPTLTLSETVDCNRNVSVTSSTLNSITSQGGYCDDRDDPLSLFNLDDIQRKISSMSTLPTHLQRDEALDPGSTDATQPPTFSSSDRHSDVNAQTLSERWGISLPTASKTLKKTTQRFLPMKHGLSYWSILRVRDWGLGV